MRSFILMALAILTFSMPAHAGWRWLWVPTRAMLVDAAVQYALTERVRSDQILMVGGMFLASQAIRTPDLEIPGIRDVPLWMRHTTLIGIELVWSQHLNVRSGSIVRKFCAPGDWAAQAPNQGKNKPLGMTGYLDHNHVAMGFLCGALSSALFPEHEPALVVMYHQFFLFEGICEAEHWDAATGTWISVPWEYGDLISDVYGCQMWNETQRR